MFRSKKGLIALLLVAFVVLDLFTPFRVRQVSIHLNPETIWRLGAFRITNTLLVSWAVMATLVLLALLTRRKLEDVPKALSLQNIVEAISEALYAFLQRIAGPSAQTFFPIPATFFLYILLSNWLELLPGVGSIGLWEEQGGRWVLVPLLRSPTADLNTTLALACCAVISLQVYGIRCQGLACYGARFLAVGKLMQFFRLALRGESPSFSLLFRGVLELFIGLMELFEDLTKILSFSFRLFGNVFGAEVLLLVSAFLAPYVVSVPFMALEVFGGFIQAFIFAVLTAAFLGAVAGRFSGPEGGDEGSPSGAFDLRNERS